jgi:signal transduction histidine kinase
VTLRKRHRLRNRLIALFLAATLAPLAATVWLVDSLIDRMSSTAQVDELSKSLEQTGRELYRRARMQMREAVEQGKLRALPMSAWEAERREFAESADGERFLLRGENGDRLLYLRRAPGNRVEAYEESLGPAGLGRIAEQYSEARSFVGRDHGRGVRTVFLLIAAAIWLAAFAALVILAHRVSQPIQELTAGLRALGQGNPNVRIAARRDDEVGQAIASFNEMAAQLARSRERLLFVARLESWQTLARKMAHEVKNSLTPIRLTVEEIVARNGAAASDPGFLKQAAQIVTDEVTGLERRVRAFSQLAAEPPVRPEAISLNALVEERIRFLSSAHPEVRYETRLDAANPWVEADEDLARGILTNLLENAAQALGTNGGTVRVETREGTVEVHDSGPGLSDYARATLFEPTISFKKSGMGIGLSIARKSALLNQGDIELIPSELGGAAFRVTLRPAKEGASKARNT